MKKILSAVIGLTVVGSIIPLFVGAQVAPASCYTPTLTLTVGATDAKTGGQVSKLQNFLKAQGVYSYPTITGYYGSVTIAAVQKWQKLKGIASSGTPYTTGYGATGPKTRAAIIATCGGKTTTTTTSTDSFTRNLGIGSTGADVKALQIFLNKTLATKIAASGAGSPGFETTYFGPATAAALKKFQAANNLPQTSILDLATRTVLNKLLKPVTDNNTNNKVIITGTYSGAGGGGGGGGGGNGKAKHNLIANADVGGSISPGGTISVDDGTSQTFTITASTDYDIADVTVDGVSIGAASSYTFSSVTTDRTISAKFKHKNTTPTTYTITATQGANGIVSPTGVSTVNSGTDKAYTITPNSGYQIGSVIVNGSSVGSPSTYTFNNVSGNQTITATFTQTPVATYSVSATAGTNGTISPSGTNSVNQGTSATYTITPDANYQVASVVVDGTNEGAITSYTFPNTTTGSHSISATFSPIVVTYTVTATAGSNGSISPAGTVSTNQGTTRAFTITPASGYQIQSVVVDGVNQGTVSSYTFPSNSSGVHSISATFNPIPVPTFTITASAGANGTISPGGATTVNGGTTQNITVTANSGYQIASVTVDGVAQTIATTYSFTNISANHTISATFSIIPIPVTVTTMTLINADTGASIRTLNSTDAIDLGTLPTKNLNIKADISSSAQSVVFGYDGNANYQTQTSVPLAFAGDNNNVYNPWTPTVGTHTITATPYTQASGAGTAGTVFTIALTVTDSSTNPPVSTKFNIGDRVQVSGANLNVRATASPTGTLNGTQSVSALGSVIGGPTANGGFNWWQVNYDTGADGWSIEDNLIKYTAVPDTTAPTISTISASNLSNTGATITWTTNESSDTQIEYGLTTSYGSVTTLATALVTSHSQALTGLTSGTLYHYRVKSKDAAGNLATSGDQTFTTTSTVSDTQAPSTPTNLVVNPVSSSQINLSWGASTDNVGVTGYRIYRNGSATPLKTVTTNSTTDIGLTASTQYSYTIDAIDAAGNASSKSTSVSGTTQAIQTGGGATYYVATTGSDSASGSSAAPWKTLQHAVDVVKPGDTVLVRAGSYAGMDRFQKPTGATASSPITFMPDSGASVTINKIGSGTNSSLALVNLEQSGGYWNIQGFLFDDVNGVTERGGIRVVSAPGSKIMNNTFYRAYTGVFVSGSDDILVENNIVHDSHTEHGMYIASGNQSGLDTRRAIIRGNTIYNACNASVSDSCPSKRDGLHMNATNIALNQYALVENNVIYNAYLSGMDIEGIQYATFRNNLIYNAGKHGIVVHSQDQVDVGVPPYSSGNTFVNNTFYGNKYNSLYFASSGDSANTTVFNNIMMPSSTFGSLTINGNPGSGFKSDYNIVVDRFSTDGGYNFKTLASWKGTGNDTHSIVSSAANLFVSPGSDFHLKAGAPAIDAGAASFNGQSAPTNDKDKNGRPAGNGYDAGAFESNGVGVPQDTTAPTVPTNLSASAQSQTQINLSWSASTDATGVAGYRIFRNGTQVGTASTNSYSDTGLTSATTYTYAVAAYDAAGNVSSQSASVSGTTQSPVPDTSAPSVPSGLSATAVSASQVNLSWSASTDNVGVTGYRVMRNGSLAGTASGSSFTDTGLSASTAYSYYVIAVDAANNASAQSGSASATTLSAGTPPTISPIAIDASSPARATTAATCSNGGTSKQVTTSSFIPPANSLIIVTVSADGDTSNCGGTPSVSVSSNTGASFTQIATESGANGGTGGFAGAWYTPSSGGAMTVTANLNVNGTVSTKVYVVTGANLSSPIGATVRGTSGSNSLTTTALTTQGSGSRVFAVGTDWNVLGTPTSSDVVDPFKSNANISGLSVYKSTNTSSAGSAVTFSLTAGGSGTPAWNWIAFEVKSASGIAFNGSSGTVAGAATQCVSINNRLMLGSSDATTNGEVSMLQLFLKAQGDYTYPEITGYFGDVTKTAVQKFQARTGLEAVGEVGLLTQAKIQQISCGN